MNRKNYPIKFLTYVLSVNKVPPMWTIELFVHPQAWHLRYYILHMFSNLSVLLIPDKIIKSASSSFCDCCSVGVSNPPLIPSTHQPSSPLEYNFTYKAYNFTQDFVLNLLRTTNAFNFRIAGSSQCRSRDIRTNWMPLPNAIDGGSCNPSL